jgi:putative ATP-dependent endonuclease of the OLD family
VLAAIAWLLTGAPDLTDEEASPGLSVKAELEAADGRRTIERTPTSQARSPLPPTMLLRASRRLPPGPSPQPGQPELSPAEVVIAWLEARVRRGEEGAVVLIEEPELDLNPQAQRYFYRVLRAFGERNQVIYSTRSPSFVDAVHHAEIIRLDVSNHALAVRRAPVELLTDEQRLRLAAEFDHERAEMFFANSVVLVEGETERQALPIIFRALGEDPDALGISITEVGGKGNLVLAARLLTELNIPHLLVYDTDRGRPGAGLNRGIVSATPDTPKIWLDPDFEGAAGIRHHHDKVIHAYERFAHAAPNEIPAVFHRIVATAVRLARRQPLEDL